MKLCAPLLAGIAALAGGLSSIHAAPARLDTRGPAGAYATGQALLKARQFRQAQVAFRQAIAQKDHVALAYAGLGTADIDLGDSAGGFKAYQQAAKLLPGNAAMNYYAGFAALYARAYTWAVTYATRSIQLHPNYYPSYHLRFLAYGRLQSKKKQVSDAHMEVKLLPRNPDTWNDYGIALGNDGQLPQSISAFGKAIKLRSSYWAYYKNRAIIEIYNKQQGRALKDFEKAGALAPDAADKKLMADTVAKLKKRMHH
jgi:tetratricopeptide (TPR) repeat protein